MTTPNSYNSDFNNNYQPADTKLQIDKPERSAGKRVFKWTFQVVGTLESEPVEVMLVNDPATDSVAFRAYAPHLLEPIQDSDIRSLQQRVFDALTSQARLRTTLHWDNWFEVIVRGSNSDFVDSKYSSLGANLHLEVRQLKRGIHPETKQPVTINKNGCVVAFPTARHRSDPNRTARNADAPESLINYAPIEFRDGEVAYIPATPENEARLRQVLRQLAEIREHVTELFSQENIQTTLELQPSHGMKALPEPEATLSRKPLKSGRTR